MRPEDFRSATWKRLSQLLEQRLEELRQLNDSPTYDAIKTAQIRGQIGELKRILALAEEASASPAVDPDELSALANPGQR
jgi:endonuclease IV